MDLSKILNLLYRYLWLFVLTILVASFTAFFVLNNQPPLYKTSTRLLVGASLDSPSPDVNALKIGGQLIMTYSDVLGSNSFLETVNNKLDPKLDANTLNDMISTKENTETRILTINVHGPDPKQVLAVANAAAQTLIEMSPSKDNTTALLRTQMTDQSHLMEQIISKNQTTIQQLETELNDLKNIKAQSPEAVKANLDQQNLIIKQLSDEHNHLSDALRTLATIYQVMLATDTNQLEIISPAEAAVAVDQNLLLRVAMAGASGLALTLIIIFTAEYLDDRIRFPGDFTRVAGVSMLNVIDRHDHLKGSGLERLVTFAQPESRAANSYREVVAKLLFSVGKATHYTFLLSSVGPQAGDDTATAAGNLAVAFAKAGNRVILIDAQFHNPVLTKMFNAVNEEGLADVVATNPPKSNLIAVEEVSGLSFLPVGLAPEKGSDAMILNSTKIAKVVEVIRKEADIVLISGSPVSWFAESLSMASRVNALILVARYGEARSKIFNRVVENLRVMNIHLAGVMFDYNPSPFTFKNDHSKVSTLARLASKVAIWKKMAIWKNFKISGRIEKSNTSQQTTKS